MAEVRLECKNVAKHFGSLKALDNVTFALAGPIIKGLIGPNGSGKTVLLNSITGIPYGPDSGSISFGGKSIEKLRPTQICRLGIARTFQTLTFFPSLTVEQNLLVATAGTNKDAVEKALGITDLGQKRSMKAGGLGVFDLKKLMIATSLGLDPRLLLLDEPLSGLSEEESLQTVAILKQINDAGIALLVVEHKLRKVVDLCSELFVMHLGKVIAEGDPSQVMNREEVLKAYFGEEEHAQG